MRPGKSYCIRRKRAELEDRVLKDRQIRRRKRLGIKILSLSDIHFMPSLCLIMFAAGKIQLLTRSTNVNKHLGKHRQKYDKIKGWADFRNHD